MQWQLKLPISVNGLTVDIILKNVHIVLSLSSDRPSGLHFSFELLLFLSILTSPYILFLLLYLILFLLFLWVSVWKTLVHEFLISYSHTEWNLFFSDSATTSAQTVFGA